VTTIRWDGANVELNEDEAEFLDGLKRQHEAGVITQTELANQVKTLMRLKTAFDAEMLDPQAAKELGL
jgi:hypothetical protein